MPWSNPDGKNNDPWGKRKPPNTPTDLDDLLKKVKQYLSLGGGGEGGSGGGGANASLIYLVIAGVIGLWMLSGFHMVGPDEEGIVLRFGQYTATESPGLHYHWPIPVERVIKVKVSQSKRIEVGYSSLGGRSHKKHLVESLMLTKDENIVDVSFSVQYRVKSATDYLFSARDPDKVIVFVAESAMREVVGKSHIDRVLTEGRVEIEDLTKTLMQESIDTLRLGLVVEAVRLQDAQAPEQVLPAFLDVVAAREDRDRAQNEAEAYANDIIPRARGKAVRLLEEAEAYKIRVVEEAKGDAARFESLLAQYRKAPEVTKKRIYLETMRDIYSRSNKVILDTKGGNQLLYLPLDKLGKDFLSPASKLEQDGQTDGMQDGGEQR